MTPTVQAIKCHVAKSFGIPRNSMEGAQRNRQIARPRQVAMFMAASLTQHSYPEIGRMFGGRDHTTVMHAVRKIRELMEINPDFADRVKEVQSAIAASPTSAPGAATADLEEAARQACKAAVRRAKTEMGAGVSGKPDTLRRTLLEAFGERTAFTGMTRDGHGVELLVSAKGAWSMIEVAADGECARMIVSGYELQSPEPTTPPAAPPAPPAAYPCRDRCMRCRKTFTRTSVGHRHCTDCRNFLSDHDSNLEA